MGALISQLHDANTTKRTIDVRKHTHTFLLDLEKILERRYLNETQLERHRGAIIQITLAELELDAQLRPKWAQMWERLGRDFKSEPKSLLYFTVKSHPIRLQLGIQVVPFLVVFVYTLIRLFFIQSEVLQHLERRVVPMELESCI